MKKLIKYAVVAYILSDEIKYVKRKIEEIVRGKPNNH